MATETKKRSKLFSMFLEETPDNSVSVAVGATPTPSGNPTVQVTATAVTSDPDIYKQLMSEIEKNNMPGYDYLEFSDAVENLKVHIAGEPERFKAAYAAVASMVKVGHIIESVDFYLDKLGEQKKDFDTFTSSMTADKVSARETEAKKIEDQVTKKQEQIAVLTKEISDLQGQRTSLLNSASQEKAKIDSVKLNYEATYKSLVDKILQDKQKIQTYIGGSK